MLRRPSKADRSSRLKYSTSSDLGVAAFNSAPEHTHRLDDFILMAPNPAFALLSESELKETERQLAAVLALRVGKPADSLQPHARQALEDLLVNPSSSSMATDLRVRRPTTTTRTSHARSSTRCR